MKLQHELKKKSKGFSGPQNAAGGDMVQSRSQWQAVAFFTFHAGMVAAEDISLSESVMAWPVVANNFKYYLSFSKKRERERSDILMYLKNLFPNT